MLEAVSISQAVARDWRDLYEAFWRPQEFSRWAAGLGGTLEPDGDAWRAVGPGGPVLIRFTPHNPFGIMDHRVETAAGAVVHVPMRIVANQEGALVQLILFRQPEMDDAAFAHDQELVAADLQTLKRLAES